MPHILVNTITGKALDLIYVDPESTVLYLKEQIAHQTGVPMLFQRLLHHATVLQDMETFQMLSILDEENISVTLLIVFDDSISELDKVHALEFVTSLFDEGCCPSNASIGISALSKFTQDETSRRVRALAVEILAQVASKGDDSVITSALACIQDDMFLVRKAAIKVLARVVQAGDRSTLAKLQIILNHDDCMLRATAVEAVTVVAGGNNNALGLILALVQDPSWRVRCAVARCLPKLATKGDDQVLLALSTLLDDTDVDVRNAAASAFEQLLRIGSQELQQGVE